MKLNDYSVRINPQTQAAELLLSVSVPLEIIDGTEHMAKEEAVRVLGESIFEIFEQIKRNES